MSLLDRPVATAAAAISRLSWACGVGTMASTSWRKVLRNEAQPRDPYPVFSVPYHHHTGGIRRSLPKRPSPAGRLSLLLLWPGHFFPFLSLTKHRPPIKRDPSWLRHDDAGHQHFSFPACFPSSSLPLLLCCPRRLALPHHYQSPAPTLLLLLSSPLVLFIVRT